MTNGTLRNYRDVTLNGPQKSLAALGDSLEGVLPKDRWVRERDKEKQWPTSSATGIGFVFARKADTLPAARVFVLVSENTGSISNVVPNEQGKLSFDQYNGILADFLEQGLNLVAPKLGVTVNATKPDRPITDWLSQAAADKLHGFSVLANKSTGASHPLDNARWLDFLVQAYRDNSTLEAGILRRWLIEIEHWPEDQAGELASEYDFSRDLLNHFTKPKTP
jgi:hypothetical protein